jgi:ribosomal protein L30E
MRVNPRSFMMGLGYGSATKSISKNPLKLSMVQESEISMELKEELKKVDSQSNNMAFKYEQLPLEKGSLVEKHNLLAVEILPQDSGSATLTSNMA